MIIEIIGVDPRNKGAGLMLAALCQLIRADFDKVRIAVPFDWPLELRQSLNLWAVVPLEAHQGRWSKIFDHFPATFRDRVGYVRRREVTVRFDASGFAYGDFWGVGKLKARLLAPLQSWKRADRLAVLLPQAFGPFTEPGMAEAFDRSVRLCDLVFVRDKASWRHVQAVVSDMSNVRLAPDFTNLLKPDLPPHLETWAGSALIIPNEKVISNSRAGARENYLNFLREAVGMLIAAGKRPAILVHEGAKDRALAADLNGMLDAPLPVVDEPSPTLTKAIIGKAELIVSSRFHGLVSALSAGRPSLACGWTHKYAELMADYGCPDHIVRLDEPDSWRPTMERFLREADSQPFRDTLAASANAQRELSKAMWADVSTLLRTRLPAKAA